jgi:hypothetical protein
MPETSEEHNARIDYERELTSDGAKRERFAVLNFLRFETKECHAKDEESSAGCRVCRHINALADRIEGGEHRPEHEEI